MKPRAELLEAIRQAPRGSLAAILAAVASRLAEPEEKPRLELEPVSGDKLLKAEEAALRLGLDVASVLRRKDWPFRRKLGRRTVRYSERALEAWLERGRS